VTATRGDFPNMISVLVILIVLVLVTSVDAGAG